MKTEIPEEISAAVLNSSAWDGSQLHFRPRWEPLAKSGSEVPSSGGIYAIGPICGLRYDKGCSRIAYIGSSNNLKKRLETHRRESNNLVIELLKVWRGGALVVTCWPFPTFSTACLRGLEAEILLAFDRAFGSMPIGNADVPEPISDIPFTDLIQISPEERLDNPPTLDEFANDFAFECERAKQMARTLPGGEFGVSLTVRLTEQSGLQLELSPSFTMISFQDPGTRALIEERQKMRETGIEKVLAESTLVAFRNMDEIKYMQALGRTDLIEASLLHMIEVQEKRTCCAMCGVCPGYYERLAVLYRKQKRHKDEVALLERFLRFEKSSAGSPEKLRIRLTRARQLLTGAAPDPKGERALASNGVG